MRTIKTPFSEPIDAMGHVPDPPDPFMEGYKKAEADRQEGMRKRMDNDAYRKMENNSRHHSHRKY